MRGKVESDLSAVRRAATNNNQQHAECTHVHGWCLIAQFAKSIPFYTLWQSRVESQSLQNAWCRIAQCRMFSNCCKFVLGAESPSGKMCDYVWILFYGDIVSAKTHAENWVYDRSEETLRISFVQGYPWISMDIVTFHSPWNPRNALEHQESIVEHPFWNPRNPLEPQDPLEPWESIGTLGILWNRRIL